MTFLLGVISSLSPVSSSSLPHLIPNHKMNLAPTLSPGPARISPKVVTEPKTLGWGCGSVGLRKASSWERSPPQPSPNLALWAPFSDLPAPESSPR